MTAVDQCSRCDAVDGGGKLRHEDVKVPVRLSLADFCALAERAAA